MGKDPATRHQPQSMGMQRTVILAWGPFSSESTEGHWCLSEPQLLLTQKHKHSGAQRASPGNVAEMPIPGPQPGTAESETADVRPAQWPRLTSVRSKAFEHRPDAT